MKSNKIRYNDMIRRCYITTATQYKDYGGRGIKVCNRWLNSFDDYCADIGKPPSDKHTIDRIDNDGNYEPSNIRWATRIMQQRNRRTNNGYKVGVRKYRQKYLAEIKRDNIYKYLGVFYTEDQASKAYLVAEDNYNKTGIL